MPVAIQHIIGTISIFLLTISIGLSFASVASFVQIDINKKEMSQVATYVSLNLVEIATLTNSSGYTLTTVKTIDLPDNVGGKGYFVELVNASGQDKGYLVKVSLISQRGVNVESFLPINGTTAGQTKVVTMREFSLENPDGTVLDSYMKDSDGLTKAVAYLNDLDGQQKAVVYGGSKAVVWARQDENTLYMGLGYLQRSS